MNASSESGTQGGAKEPAPPGPPDTGRTPVPPPGSSLAKRLLLPILKFGIAGGLLYYVLQTKMNSTAKDELKRIFVDSPGILLLAIGTFTVQLFIGAHRMRVLLLPQEVPIRYFQALRLNYLGAFFDTFMVTSVGGDAVKAIYLARESPPGRRLQAVSVLLLDRLIGLLGLLALMVLMTLVHYQQLNADPDIQPYMKWLLLVPIMLLIGTAMLLSGRMYRIFSSIFGLSNRYRVLHKLSPLASTLDRVYASLQKYRERKLVLFHAWVLSLAVHLFGVICGYVLLGGMGQGNRPFGPFLVAWFISNFICSFAPFGGIGVGQTVFDPIFLKIADVQNGWVLATAVQATAILAKMPGLVAWIASREQTPTSGPDKS